MVMMDRDVGNGAKMVFIGGGIEACNSSPELVNVKSRSRTHTGCSTERGFPSGGNRLTAGNRCLQNVAYGFLRRTKRV